MEFPGKRKAVEMGKPSPITKRVRVQEVIGNAQEDDDWSPSDKFKEPETIPVDWIAQSGQDDETIPEVWKVPAEKEILDSQEKKDEDCLAHENVKKSLENDAKNESSPGGWTKRNEGKDELSHRCGLAKKQVITLDSSTIETQAADFDRVVQPAAGHSTKEAELEIVVQSKPGSATTGVKPIVTGVMVRGGKAGKGAPCMSVKDIAEHFKSISRTQESTIREGVKTTHKRKLMETDNLGTPRKKVKFKSISSFWKNQPGNSDKDLQGMTMADELRLDNSGSFGGNAGID